MNEVITYCDICGNKIPICDYKKQLNINQEKKYLINGMKWIFVKVVLMKLDVKLKS